MSQLTGHRSKATESTQMFCFVLFFYDDSGQRCSCTDSHLRENTAPGTAEQHELGLKYLQQIPASESRADTTQFVRIRTVSVGISRRRTKLTHASEAGMNQETTGRDRNVD